jgi:hypothetical protein
MLINIVRDGAHVTKFDDTDTVENNIQEQVLQLI